MMVGVVFFFGTILGDMGSALTNSDQKRAVYKHKLDAVIDYMVSDRSILLFFSFEFCYEQLM